MSRPLVLFLPVVAPTSTPYHVGRQVTMPIHLGPGHAPEWVDVPVTIEAITGQGIRVRIDDPDYAAALRASLSRGPVLSMSSST